MRENKGKEDMKIRKRFQPPISNHGNHAYGIPWKKAVIYSVLPDHLCLSGVSIKETEETTYASQQMKFGENKKTASRFSKNGYSKILIKRNRCTTTISIIE